MVNYTSCVDPQISHREKILPIPTTREKLVPIRHVLHTLMKNAHVVKLYVAFMRTLIPPK